MIEGRKDNHPHYPSANARLLQVMTILMVMTLTQACRKAESTVGGDQSSTGSVESNPESTDPTYLKALSEASKFAEVFWDERFIRCGTTSEGYERWFSVEETTYARRYLEVINLRTVTVLSPRISSADKLNRLWYGVSSVSAKASRWCDDSSCEGYSGGLVGVEQFALFTLGITIKNGVATTSEEGRLMSLYKPTCDEIQKHRIWQ
jgi:hypothetical protein